jgi:hypothetical protein
MNKLQELFLYFLIGCIGARLILVYVAKITDTEYLPYLGILGLFPAFGFSYIYFFNGRKSKKGAFDEDIWWDDIRPLHILLWFLFSISAFLRKQYAWIFLLTDVTVGLVAFLTHHYRNGDMLKVFS